MKKKIEGYNLCADKIDIFSDKLYTIIETISQLYYIDILFISC